MTFSMCFDSIFFAHLGSIFKCILDVNVHGVCTVPSFIWIHFFFHDKSYSIFCRFFRIENRQRRRRRWRFEVTFLFLTCFSLFSYKLNVVVTFNHATFSYTKKKPSHCPQIRFVIANFSTQWPHWAHIKHLIIMFKLTHKPVHSNNILSVLSFFASVFFVC